MYQPTLEKYFNEILNMLKMYLLRQCFPTNHTAQYVCKINQSFTFRDCVIEVEYNFFLTQEHDSNSDNYSYIIICLLWKNISIKF